MTGQVAALLQQGPVSVSAIDSTCVNRRSSAKVLSCSGGGQHLSAGRYVKFVRGRGGVEAVKIDRYLVGKRVKSSIEKRNFPVREPLNWVQRDPRRRWRAKSNTSLTHSPAEPSTGDESPLTSADPKEDQPMRNAGFVARFLRVFARFWKRYSPRNILNGVVAFLRGRGRRFVFLWSAVACTMGLIFLSGTLGSGSPRVVPYSELVNHLQAKSVTTALFEEGSSHLFFNLEPAEDGAAAVLESGDAKVSEELMATSPMMLQEGLVSPTSETDAILPSSSSELGDRDQGVPSSRQKALKSGSPKWAYSTRRIRNDEAFLLPLMRDAGVRYSSAPQSMGASFKTVIITAMTLWIPLSPLLWLLHRQMSHNGGGKKKRNVNRLVRFEDVAGVDIAKAELMEIVECMRGVPKFSRLGAKVPKGVLLVGPPGTGKTLLARAVAGEARVPFFAASASEFVEMFVGRGAARIRELFSEARKHTPSIVFIDELDAVGGPRGRSFNDERDQTLNQLLTEMDGFESETGVLVIAATNRPNALDPALCRPGRLSRRVHVTEPDLEGRQQVLAVHMRGVPVAEDPVPLRRVVASMTAGFVGADLANLVNEAALLAARKGRGAVIFEDFREAIDRVKYGVGNRRQNVFKEVEQKVGSWFSGLYPTTAYPAAPSGS